MCRNNKKKNSYQLIAVDVVAWNRERYAKHIIMLRYINNVTLFNAVDSNEPHCNERLNDKTAIQTTY